MGYSHWDSEGWQKTTMRWILNANIRAAEMGFPEAQNEMGVRCFVGEYVEKNRASALDWFGKAAAQGNADACYNLGICHAYGKQNEINISVAVDYFKWAANLGCLEAASILAESYVHGRLTGVAAQEAIKWFRMLCQRNPKAQEFKRPVSQECQDDPERSRGVCDWLDIAADAGVKEAQYFKARFVYDSVSYQRTFNISASLSEHFDQSAHQAVALFRSSSESGFLPSVTCLGDCYRTAFGVEKNIPEALRLYGLAADKGYAPAKNALADIYFQGVDCEKDLPKAIGLYEEAAAQGNANAQYSLGMCYFTGDGVDKDIGKAWMLLTRAAHGRVERAYEPHQVVEDLVTPQERAKWDEGRRMNPFSRQYSLEELRKWMYNNNYPSGFVAPYSRDYDWRKILVDLGNAKALCDIGVDLIENPTSDGDWNRAFGLFTKAADLGEPSAFFNIGKCLMEGIGAEVDKARALTWLEKACASGYKSIQPLLADCYCDGIGCDVDVERAIVFYKQNLMKLDERPKQAFLGVRCNQVEKGGVIYHFSPKERWIELMAGVGDAESQYDMGWRLAYDLNQVQGGEKCQEALSWFRKAAEQGHAEAENRLGECYRDGQGIAPDMSEAIRWFERAAEQNNPDALFNLGSLYYDGKGVKRDWGKARELFNRAVEADKHGWPNRVGEKARNCLRDMDETASGSRTS